MKLQISWHNLTQSDAVETTIRKHYLKLQQFCDSITSARIRIDQPNTVNGHQKTYAVLLELHVPGQPIIVSHSSLDAEHHLDSLIHRAFDSARRQLQDYVRIRRGKIKHHEHQSAPVRAATDTEE